MTLARRTALAAMLATPFAAHAQEKSAMLKDLARRAAIYLFPVYEMYRTRWQATVNEANPLRQKLNRFFHVPLLADHRRRQVTTPNNDTLYSTAWLDLSIEPLFLTVPPMGELYYSYTFMDLFTNNFAYVSHRLNGGQPRPHMIVGPNWKGDAAADVTVIRAPTNPVWLLGRILVDGPEDLDRVRTLQSRALLETPDMRNERRILETQELMRQRTIAPPESVADWPALNKSDPFDLFEVGMRALGESPLAERDRVLFEDFAPLRLKPGRRFDVRAFSDTERQAILDGMTQAQSEIRAAGRQYGKTVNGWSYGERHLGNFGTDYLYRALVALTGLAALEPAEAVYMTCNADGDGKPLTGANRYTLTFPAGSLPPARAFWSLAMYEVTPEGRAFFTENPLGRYGIGDRTKDLKHGADGSLTLYLQRDQPDGDKVSNWLPAPSGPLRLVLRAYEPDEAMIDNRYRVPAVQRIN